jgi:hypothetical protein
VVVVRVWDPFLIAFSWLAVGLVIGLMLGVLLA